MRGFNIKTVHAYLHWWLCHVENYITCLGFLRIAAWQWRGCGQWKVTCSCVLDPVSQSLAWDFGYDCLRPRGHIFHFSVCDIKRQRERQRQIGERALTLTSYHVESQQRCWCWREGHVPSAAEGSFCVTQRWTYREGRTLGIPMTC